MGDVNSAEVEELRLIDWLHQSGFTLIRAVLRMGRDGWEVIVDLVMAKMV